MIHGARILVVEDEPFSRDMLARLLSSHGFLVDSVEDGASALEWFDANEVDLMMKE